MKENVNSKVKDIEMVSELPAKKKGIQITSKDKDVASPDDDEDDDGDIDEYLDWRSKKAYK